jgi:hypothetical protein
MNIPFLPMLFGSIPDSAARKWPDRLKLAGLRALRTFLQGVAGALVAGGPGSAALSVGYWEAFGIAVIGAAIAALASFLQNVAAFLPDDPGQNPAPQP